MSAMFEGGYRIKDGKIQELCEGETHYWINVCEDTPENRKKYGIKD